MTRSSRAASLATALAFGVSLVPASAQDVAEFYKGRQVQMIIPSSPGGGYDHYGRLLATGTSKHVCRPNPSYEEELARARELGLVPAAE